MVRCGRAFRRVAVGKHIVRAVHGDYMTFMGDGLRGKCREYSEQACLEDSTLRLCRGFYNCPIWGLQPHWWTMRNSGEIYDPTKDQFPSHGYG
jgi:hypothetical protein